MDVASMPDIALDGGGERGGTAAEVKFVGMGGWADNEEEAINLEGVASACHHLLARAPPGHWGGEERGGDDRQSSFLWVGLPHSTNNPQKRPWTNPVTSIPLVISAPHEGKKTHPPPPLDVPHFSPCLMSSEMPSFLVALRGKARFAPPVQCCMASTIHHRRRLIALKILFIFVKIDVIYVICFVLLAVDIAYLIII